MLQLNTTEMLLELDLNHCQLEIADQEVNLSYAQEEISIGQRILRTAKTDMLREAGQSVLVEGRLRQRKIADRLFQLQDKRVKLLNQLLLCNEDYELEGLLSL